jgi:sugar transferase (PEP-CTERM/EpsH1 system associated)
MAQYGDAVRLPSDAVRIIDFCDVDSDKWAQYARSHGQPLKWLYAREARLLAEAEAGFVREFDTSLVISEVEAEILRAATGTLSTRIAVVPNGVDAAYFDPGLQHARPFPVEGRNLVFTGAMDYQANVDAVSWFAHEVFPMVRRRFPDVSFVIVGSNPASAVERLVALPGVQVTGRVPDVRPYLAHADVVVAPLRIARGVQNKVLEAFSMARPVVATPNALQGIPDAVQSGVYCCAEADDMANSILHVLQSTSAEPRGRQFVQQRFTWSSHTSRLFQYFNQTESVDGARLAEARA